MAEMTFDEACPVIYQRVRDIPSGCVSTYGQIALLCGLPGRARLVGRALAQVERRTPEEIPCHRVVNAAGRIAPGWPEQRALLLEEGVRFKDGERVDLKRCLWRPFDGE